MKKVYIFLTVLLVVAAIWSIKTQTNTSPVRIESSAAVGALPVSPNSEQPDTAMGIASVSLYSEPSDTALGIVADSSISSQADTALKIAKVSPANAQPGTAVKTPQVTTKSGTAVRTSGGAPVSVRTSTAAEKASVSPTGTQPATSGKVSQQGSAKKTDTADKTPKVAPATSAKPNAVVEKALAKEEKSPVVETGPVSKKDDNTVETPAVSGQPTAPINIPSPSTSSQIPEALRTLYVDGLNGNDAIADGSSARPWKTIKKAVGYLKPGDVLSIMGGVYKERIFISKSGTVTNRIIIGAFGNGEVIIDASLAIGEWAPDTSIQGLYKAECSFKPTAVVVNEQPIFPAFVLADIKQGEWFYNATQHTLYLYPNAGIKPTNSNVGVISDDQYSDGVTINSAHYVTLYGLTVKYAGGKGISILGNYNEIRRCNVKFNGSTGINIFTYGTTKSTDTVVAENNIYHNFIRNWPRGRYKWGSWGGGAITHAATGTKYISNISHNNGGEGLLSYGGSGGTVWRDNIVYDNWSVNIYIDNQPDGIIDGNTIFCSEPNPHDLYHNGDTNPGDNKNLGRLRAEGIMTADEDYKRTPPANLNNVKITNNIISGCRRAINHYGEALGSGLKNVLVSNNTIILPDAKGVGESFIGLQVPYNKGNNLNVVFENNRIYATDLSTYLLYLGTDSSTLPLITLKNITFRGNTWYHKTKSNAFHVGPDYHTTYDVDFNKWHSICGTNCIADKYSNLTAKIKPVLDQIELIKTTYK